MGRVFTWIGGLGASVGIVCCVTPVLPLALSAIGLGGWISTLYRDAVLLPFAAASACLLVLGLITMRRAT